MVRLHMGSSEDAFCRDGNQTDRQTRYIFCDCSGLLFPSVAGYNVIDFTETDDRQEGRNMTDRCLLEEIPNFHTRRFRLEIGKQGVAMEDVFWLAHGPFPLPDPLAAPMFVLTFVIYQITMQS